MKKEKLIYTLNKFNNSKHYASYSNKFSLFYFIFMVSLKILSEYLLYLSSVSLTVSVIMENKKTVKIQH